MRNTTFVGDISSEKITHIHKHNYLHEDPAYGFRILGLHCKLYILIVRVPARQNELQRYCLVCSSVAPWLYASLFHCCYGEVFQWHRKIPRQVKGDLPWGKRTGYLIIFWVMVLLKESRQFFVFHYLVYNFIGFMQQSFPKLSSHISSCLITMLRRFSHEV